MKHVYVWVGAILFLAATPLSRAYAGPGRSQPEGTAVPYTPSPDLKPAVENSALEERIARSGSKVGLPDDRDRIREYMRRRWESALKEASREWENRSSRLYHLAPVADVDTLNSKETAATVKYKQNGQWQYPSGKAEEVLPKTNEGIGECWKKVYSSTQGSKGLSFLSPNPTRFSFWKKLAWDGQANQWAVVTTAERRKVRESYEKWLVEKILAERQRAAAGPNEAQLGQAKAYALRATETQKKLAETVKPEETRKLEFQRKSDLDRGFERLVLAFDAEFQSCALEMHERDFRKTPWDSP